MVAVANFIEVATGEGDYHLERLSLLHSVATGYSSLIFDMKPNMGFAELYRNCNTLWSVLEENPELPKFLVIKTIITLLLATSYSYNLFISIPYSQNNSWAEIFEDLRFLFK